jgi:hypothetical protein
VLERPGECRTTKKTVKKVLAGPAKIDGGITRVVELPDGSGRVESWVKGKGWVEGGATADEFFFAPPVSPELAARMGMPTSELPAPSSTVQAAPDESFLEKMSPGDNQPASSKAAPMRRDSTPASPPDRRWATLVQQRVFGRALIRTGAKHDDPEMVQHGWKLVRAAAGGSREGDASSRTDAVGGSTSAATDQKPQPSSSTVHPLERLAEPTPANTKSEDRSTAHLRRDHLIPSQPEILPNALR